MFASVSARRIYNKKSIFFSSSRSLFLNELVSGTKINQTSGEASNNILMNNWLASYAMAPAWLKIDSLCTNYNRHQMNHRVKRARKWKKNSSANNDRIFFFLTHVKKNLKKRVLLFLYIFRPSLIYFAYQKCLFTLFMFFSFSSRSSCCLVAVFEKFSSVLAAQTFLCDVNC